jgi:hypothetical protein
MTRLVPLGPSPCGLLPTREQHGQVRTGSNRADGHPAASGNEPGEPARPDESHVYLSFPPIAPAPAVVHLDLGGEAPVVGWISLQAVAELLDEPTFTKDLPAANKIAEARSRVTRRQPRATAQNSVDTDQLGSGTVGGGTRR